MKNDTVTKADLNELKIEIKDEMKEMREEFGAKFIDLSMKVEQNSLELNDKFDKVITTLDGLAGLISDGRVEKAAAESTFRRHEAKLDEHENRIGNLERNAV